MKNILLRGIMSLLIVVNSSVAVIAADTVPQKIHHFAVITADSTKVGEAIDVTVEARDKDDKLIPTYRGSIFFQSTDYNATLPSQGKSVTFSETDNGVKKLSKAVIFKKVGTQTLEVSDAVEDAGGKKSIRVDAADTTSNTGTTDAITIITPKNDDIYNADDFIVVSGYAKKNSKVAVKLNGSEIATVAADDSGLYTKTLPSLTQQSNIVVVEQLDGTNQVTSSANVRFSLSNTNPKFINLVITPGLSIDAGSNITFAVEADPGLTEVNINLDGSIIPLKETTSGKYSAETPAPAKPGSYPVTVNMKNNLGQGTTKSNAATLTVNEKKVEPAKFSNVKVETSGTKVVFTFSVENAPVELSQFKIAYGASADSLSEQVITKKAADIMTSTGTYTWYIDKLEPKTYAFRIFGMKEDQSLIANFASEAITHTVGAPGCTIANVGTITVKTEKDKSILSWLSVTGAVSYNIYKMSAAGDAEFIQNTKDTNYTLFLSSGSVAYSDFGIKALCDEKTESADLSKASKVQTGPGMIAFLVIFSAIIGVVIMRRRTSY